MMIELICPECDEEIKVIPVRESLPEDITSNLTLMQTASTTFGPSYGPTSKTYKCTNPKCWVTKVELSWL